MEEWISKLDKWLPHWFEKTQMQWIQWIYALWQLVRGNALTLLVLSFLPFYLAQRRKKKAVVVLGHSKDYETQSVDEMIAYFNSHPLKNLEIDQRVGYCFAVKHGGHTYQTHQNTLCELAKCSQLFGENVIFVDRLLPVTASLAVGRKLSQTEAYERIFSKRCHCGKGADYVVPSFLDYGDLNSKIWGVLSTIPILLQARSFNRLSNLLSIVIIILDFNRGWLYKIYDYLFYNFAKYVKLHVFKERTALYNICSIFSSRWKYSDTVKKHAYVAQPGDILKIGLYNKLGSLEDIELGEWETHSKDANDQFIYMEIDKDRAYCRLMEYGARYEQVTLRRRLYVS